MKIVNGWLDEALDGHYGAKSSSRAGYAVKYLVLHGTAGGSSAAGIDDYFTNGVDASGQPVQASSHVIIDQAGTVIQGISFDMAAWANCCTSLGHAPYLADGNFHNQDTISIEHVKSHDDNSDVLTFTQARKSFEVIAAICDAYNIPKRAGDAQGGILSHADLDPVNRSRCPGPYPFDALWVFLQSGGSTMPTTLTLADVVGYFVDDGNGNWKCVNGVTLIGGNLAFYRTNNGLELFGLPLANEIALSQYPGTAIVPCERAMIVYDPERIIDKPPIEGPCYLLHIDSGVGQRLLQDALFTQITALQTQVTQLKAVIDSNPLAVKLRVLKTAFDDVASSL